MAVKGPGPILSQDLLNPVQHFYAGLMPLQLPQGAGVEVPKVHCGNEPFIQGTQLQYLV
jgi:hypothetical protein